MITNFQQHLNEQLYFLDSSLTKFSINHTAYKLDNKVLGTSRIFNISDEIEAKRIATCIRVLVHDTNTSHSLLLQMNEKTKIKFIDSSSPNDGKLHSMTGMTSVTGTNKNHYFGLVAKINNQGNFNAIPLFNQHLIEWYKSYRYIEFHDWWNQVIISVEENRLTRKDLVLAISNKDGGAHVDVNQSKSYSTAKNTTIALNVNEIEIKFLRNGVYASVAQIGWELLNSI